jgi:peptidoglycan/LPS O-acetylase OafA/YrhL
MENRPSSVVIASLLALLGAFVALIVAVIGLDIEGEGLLMKMAFSLLTMVLFLALAGSLNKNGQWSWRFVIFAAALCAAVPIMAYAFKAMNFAASLFLVVLAAVIILMVSTEKTKDWIEADRL